MCITPTYFVIFSSVVVIYVASNSNMESNISDLCRLPSLEKMMKTLWDCGMDLQGVSAQAKAEMWALIDSENSRNKRSTTKKSLDDCLAHCTLRRLNAFNGTGYPSEIGLFYIFTEGSIQPRYKNAVEKAVSFCVKDTLQQIPLLNDASQGSIESCNRSLLLSRCIINTIGPYCFSGV